MAVVRCQTCHQIVSAHDFYLNLPQGPVCSSCLVNRVCAVGELKVRARAPERHLDLDGLEDLYPGVRPAAVSPGVPASKAPAQSRSAVLDRILSNEPGPARPAGRIPGTPPAGFEPRSLREIQEAALEEEAEEAWAMPGFRARPA